MRIYLTYPFHLLTATVILFLAGCPIAASSGPNYLAYSLREASRQAERGEGNLDLRSLGGITRIAGMVYDKETKDVVLIGLAAPELPQAHLDDLIVALRARLLHDTFPLVSIDPVSDTETTRLQQVRFGGNLEDTRFGRIFLDCDVIMKRYSLASSKCIEQVRPYTRLIEEDLRNKLAMEGLSVLDVKWLSAASASNVLDGAKGMNVSQAADYQARFWFYVSEPYNAACKPNEKTPEVFMINELRLCVKAEDMLDMQQQEHARVSDAYSQDWSAHFDAMCEAFPTLRYLKLFYDLTAVADAICYLEEQPYLKYLLERYKVAETPTPRTWDLEETFGRVVRSDGKDQLIRVCGGIEFKTELQLLNYGDITALRDIVLQSRPSDDALVWSLPLEAWDMPNATDLQNPHQGENRTALEPKSVRESGCSLVVQSVVLEPQSSVDGVPFNGFSLPEAQFPPLKGVSMCMHISDNSFIQDDTGQLDKLRDSLLKNRGNGQNITWPDTGNNK